MGTRPYYLRPKGLLPPKPQTPEWRYSVCQTCCATMCSTPMKRSARFVIVALLVGLCGILVVFHAAWTPTRILGLALMIPGFALLTIARIHLGNAFSVAPRASTLVTAGVYSRIRNPIYIFSTIGLTGVFLYLNQPLWLLILVPLVFVQTWRAHAEARVLEARFGDQYRRYRTQTWF
jgi:protein-S-isoprenylcysteine O-methyltransferase Ste14